MSTHFNYCEPPDVPEGMTLAAYRRDRARKRKPSWRARLLRRSRRVNRREDGSTASGPVE
jgi:hypothetical protein